MSINITLCYWTIFHVRIFVKTWHESGTLNKELEIYKMLNEKYGVRFKFITYGDKNEIDYIKGYDFISVIPVFAYFKNLK